MRAPAVADADFVYALEFLRDGKPVGSVSVAPDLAPVVEAARWAALRAGLPPEAAFLATPHVEPMWCETLGEPYATGLRASIAVRDHDTATVDVPRRFFGTCARDASAALVEQGLATAGESLGYLVAAYPSSSGRSPTSLDRPTGVSERGSDGKGLRVEELPTPLPVRDAVLAERLAGSTVWGTGEDGDMPVVMARPVLDDALALVAIDEGIETGGFLVGHVCRDTGSGDVFLDVTELLPARHTRATSSSLTFTSDTWWDARAAIALRARGETFLGWMHTHPVTAMCREKGCSEEAQRTCPMAKGFFSEHDRFLHRTMFPRAYGIALVINDWAFAAPSPSLFGYRAGLIEVRGFHVT
jgi:hypothetical protein